MARNVGTAGTEGRVALTAATVRTAVQIVAPANQMIAPLAVRVSFDGITATNVPVIVELLRQTTAGTMTARTPRKTRVGGPTLQFTAQHSATAEPTAGDVLREWEIHPQSGVELSLDLGADIEVDGGGRLGLRCTAAEAVNVRAAIDVEE